MRIDENKWPETVYVLIPAYQSAEPLKKFLPRLIEAVPVSQLCIVDDGSNDETKSCCTRFGVRCLRHEINKGKGAALVTGFASLLEQGADAIITMDADGQHAVEDLSCFLDAYRTDPEAGIIVGRRKFEKKHMPFWRMCSNRITSRTLSWIAGVPILDSQCGYRLYSARLLKCISITCPRFEMESEVLLKAARFGFPVRFVVVQTLYFRGPSHISHLADTLRWIKAVVKIWFDLRKPGSTFRRNR